MLKKKKIELNRESHRTLLSGEKRKDVEENSSKVMWNRLSEK